MTLSNTKVVLIAIGNPNLNHLVEKIVTRLGFIAESTFTALEALSVLDVVEVDLLIANSLPDSTLPDFLSAVNQQDATVPIVVLSQPVAPPVNHSQVKEVVTKPFRVDVLEAAIRASIK
jgi:DNA-binding response OmpR family regulator